MSDEPTATTIDPREATRVVLARLIKLGNIEMPIPQLVLVRSNRIGGGGYRGNAPFAIGGAIAIRLINEYGGPNYAPTSGHPWRPLTPMMPETLQLPAIFVSDDAWLDAWVDLVDRGGYIVMSADAADIDKLLEMGHPPPKGQASAPPAPSREGIADSLRDRFMRALGPPPKIGRR